jgi:hypothetical protein
MLIFFILKSRPGDGRGINIKQGLSWPWNQLSPAIRKNFSLTNYSDGLAEGEGVGVVSESELGDAEGDGEGLELLELFFLAELVEDEEVLASELFFFAAVELELVPDFFSPVVVFLPAVELDVVELVDEDVSLFLAHETKKASATASVMKEKMVFFIRFVRAVSLFRGDSNRKLNPSTTHLSAFFALPHPDKPKRRFDTSGQALPDKLSVSDNVTRGQIIPAEKFGPSFFPAKASGLDVGRWCWCRQPH